MNTLRYRVINIVLMFVMLSHLTFIHNFIYDYVLCYGNDGHIQIENINEFENCKSRSIFEVEKTISTYIISSVDCEDVSLDENCFEEEQFIFNKRVNSYAVILKSNISIYLTENQKNGTDKIEINRFGSNVLENYTTVSLLI